MMPSSTTTNALNLRSRPPESLAPQQTVNYVSGALDRIIPFDCEHFWLIDGAIISSAPPWRGSQVLSKIGTITSASVTAADMRW